MATALMHMRAPLAPHTAAQHNPRVCSRVVSVPRSYQSCRVAVTCPQQQCFSTRAGISGRAESSLALARKHSPGRMAVVVSATAVGPGGVAEPPEEQPTFVQKLTKSIRDFGLGKKALFEGGVGAFAFGGIGIAIMLITWSRGGSLFRRDRGYNVILEFPSACGIMTGTPVRIRGVPVGSAINVEPSLEKVDVYVEMKDPTTVIPRNALIEANQSGLIAESLIDITPQEPIPQWKASPLEKECEGEGQIVCHQGRIKGQPGVAMDDLIYISTKLMRQFDAVGMDKFIEAAETATQAIEDARPLLHRATELADQVIPLLQELRAGDMVGNVEALTRSAAQAAADLHRLQNEVLTEDNVEAIRGSVTVLTRTLEHVEAISGDVGGLTADSRVKANLKQLIEALSRLSVD
mmetsp:Transcript_15027/g.45378  ORF Transcript_15027/g.45378 Transcript_15027/m.45378 type:complete len:407 (-) Transcript_15027:771-1991(-)|eukprot:CAMPEP_0206134680 /NCGR_PEP_ID=MMETSP1473-20131121/150_1 /ASSEMBLY_ACC=CAM_ASM_001109 /TAXON_ID=1461547 /ORGANISM="Stichococcus sp, Strain RCC1054" /LENGTH=406 /DNA_ID=CAMNT_0053526299 /DNA_START=193 /DNA_END=1413 /DNA_ORIENTATION=+